MDESEHSFVQRVYVVVETGFSNTPERHMRMVMLDREDINPRKHYRDTHAINAALKRLMKRCNEQGVVFAGGGGVKIEFDDLFPREEPTKGKDHGQDDTRTH